MKISRRSFITKSVSATAGISLVTSTIKADKKQVSYPVSNKINRPEISIFSKNLHWLNYAAMASTTAQLGFDGVDLTVRPEGHVLPERVAEDLPKAVNEIRKAGLTINMITTAILDADAPQTESILKTASAQGIKHYRMGWIEYDLKKSITDNLKSIETQLRKLEKLNRKYKIKGGYQNHSGLHFGAPVWDLVKILEKINSPWLGVQYDVRHATVEGANSWPLGFSAAKDYIYTIAIKDFHWVNKNEKWQAESVPLGEGVVDLKTYLKLLKENQINAPVTIHYEYPLGGADQGAKVLTIPKEDVLALMKKDLEYFKAQCILHEL
jgi:L-ribulose-5-phosphate 3-epimerase